MGLTGDSRALFHAEIASESNFDLESHFVLFLRQFAKKKVDDVVESSEHNLFPCCLSTKFAVCIFSGI